MADVIEELILRNLENIKDELIEHIGYQNTDRFLIVIGEQLTDEIAECVPRSIVIEKVPPHIIEQLLSDVVEQTTRDIAEQMLHDLKKQLKHNFIRNTFKENVAKKLIADGELALEEISELCNLPIETVRELAAAAKANQTVE